MPQFLTTLLRSLRGARGSDMRLLCRQLLSQRGEASQTALAQRILEQYKTMDSDAQLAFFEMLAGEFSPDQNALQRAIDDYKRAGATASIAALWIAAEPPRQELFRRINTGPAGTQTLVQLRHDLLRCLRFHPHLAVVDSDL